MPGKGLLVSVGVAVWLAMLGATVAGDTDARTPVERSSIGARLPVMAQPDNTISINAPIAVFTLLHCLVSINMHLSVIQPVPILGGRN